LNNFFTKPAGSPSKPKSSQDVAVKAEGPASVAAASTSSTKVESPEVEKPVSDYEKTFHPFFVKSGVTVAPTHRFQKDEDYKEMTTRSLDKALSLPKEPNKEDAMEVNEEPAPLRTICREEFLQLLDIPPHKATKRGKLLEYGTKDILARINAPDDPSLPPLEPSKGSKPRDATYYVRLLNRLPHKLLKFAEDVRPPYVGTYTRKPIDAGLSRGRNPFKRALPRVNYDYDSEAEWVADEEGEELLSGDEDEEDDDTVSEDMEGFLDDENDAGVRRGGIGALVAMSSGLCWEDENGKSQRADFEGMRMEVLIGTEYYMKMVIEHANRYIRRTISSYKPIHRLLGPFRTNKEVNYFIN
jgi:chromatin assembly factor 1 subunit A